LDTAGLELEVATLCLLEPKLASLLRRDFIETRNEEMRETNLLVWF
jgi:hypothetical protein